MIQRRRGATAALRAANARSVTSVTNKGLWGLWGLQAGPGAAPGSAAALLPSLTQQASGGVPAPIHMPLKSPV
jgi:hypothetical protein